jgi:hypothetical protein
MRNKDGVILCSPRHWDGTAHALVSRLEECSFRGAEQGFVDQRGEFLTREEAHHVALKAGQIIRRCGGDDGCLYSENLY